MVSKMAYGARVRKVEVSRGNRQGNNAFLQYIDNYEKNPVQQITDEHFIKKMVYNHNIGIDTYKQIFKLNPQIEQHL